MAYQVKYTCGHEIVVIGNLCQIHNSNGVQVYAGTWEACLKWLEERGMRSIG